MTLRVSIEYTYVYMLIYPYLTKEVDYMFTAKYNPYSKQYCVYKEHIECAIYKDDILNLTTNFTFTINDICEILDLCNF